MTELIPNFIGGQWQTGSGTGTALFDPVLGTELVRVDATGLDLAAGFAFAREQGGAALRALTYRERAAILGAAVKVLQANRDAYYDIAIANSGTVKNDTAVDIDGGIFTLGTYARMGETLGDRNFMLDGEPARLGKDPLFQSQHVLTPTRGVALFINAFNFPVWGMLEKLAPAFLAGVPTVVAASRSAASSASVQEITQMPIAQNLVGNEKIEFEAKKHWIAQIRDSIPAAGLILIAFLLLSYWMGWIGPQGLR